MTSGAIRLMAGFCFLLFSAGSALAQGPTLLTVTGDIGGGNRGASNSFDDAFLSFRERAFDEAFVFDRAALEALPQISLSARADTWPRTVEARGPRLVDVLSAAGVSQSASISLMALDGYSVVLGPEERASGDWILAIDAEGEPLGLGGRGPAWLLQDTGGEVVTAEREALWIWSVFLIEVE